MNKKQGVKDLMDEKRFSARHLKKALQERNVPGNWDTYQNVYNLINGRVPRDAYTYIVISDLLDEDLRTVITRYSSVEDNVMQVVREEATDFNW